MPVVTGRRVNISLCGGHCVNSGNKSLSDLEVVMDGLDCGGWQWYCTSGWD